jgi:hypothetical protein
LIMSFPAKGALSRTSGAHASSSTPDFGRSQAATSISRD